MKQANETVDILDHLLTDVSQESIPGIKELSDFVYQNRRPAGPMNAALNELPETDPSNATQPANKKVTYYLSERVLVELYDAKAKIKVQVPKDMKSKVSMSKIVDYAVKAIVDEFKEVGIDNEVVQQILKKE